MQEAASPMEQTDFPGSRLRSVSSQGDAGVELLAVGQHGPPTTRASPYQRRRSTASWGRSVW